MTATLSDLQRQLIREIAHELRSGRIGKLPVDLLQMIDDRIWRIDVTRWRIVDILRNRSGRTERT
jgi:hypothetical protein